MRAKRTGPNRIVGISMLFFALVSAAYAGAEEELSFLYMAQAGYQPEDIQSRAEAYHRVSGRRVRVSFLEYEAMYEAIVASSAGESAAYDVVLTDLIWIADFVKRKLIEPVPASYAREIRSGVSDEISSAFTYRGELWSFPFLANMQLLFANRDILDEAGVKEVPSGLRELVAAAETVKRKGLLKYPLFDSWKTQEVLVCEFTWMTGAFGGSLSGPDGRPKVNGEASKRALEFMVSLLDRGLMNPYSLESDELFASEVFLNGDAAFTTNWTFLLRFLKAFPYSKARMVVAPIPVFDPRNGPAESTVSGFQGLSVARNSGKKKEAWDFIRFLASPEFQREHLSELPVWKSVWKDPRIGELDPDIGVKLRQLEGVRNRPNHPEYRTFSSILQDALSQALRKKKGPREALDEAQRLVERLGS